MPSLYAMDATMKGIGREGKLALDAIRKEIPDWDARVEKARSDQTLKEAPSEVGPGQGKRTDRLLDNIKKSVPSDKGGTSAEYLASRLKRDAPEIAKQLERGVINPFFSLI